MMPPPPPPPLPLRLRLQVGTVLHHRQGPYSCRVVAITGDTATLEHDGGWRSTRPLWALEAFYKL
jgi:hypothetical protein